MFMDGIVTLGSLTQAREKKDLVSERLLHCNSKPRAFAVMCCLTTAVANTNSLHVIHQHPSTWSVLVTLSYIPCP